MSMTSSYFAVLFFNFTIVSISHKANLLFLFDLFH